MEDGFYWVKYRNGDCEVWCYVGGLGWYEPMKDTDIGISPETLLSLGYEVISEKLEPPT